VPLAGTPAAINYPGGGGTLNENVYVLGSDGQLYLDYYDAGSWNWINLGTGGVPLSGSPAAINYPGSDGTLHENVYVLGSGGNLYLASYDGGWNWINLGNAGVSLSGNPVAINYPASDGTLHENVYALGSDGNLYIDAYDGGSWSWVNLGNGGVSLSGSPAAINYTGTDGVPHENVYVLGSDGNLYIAVYDGTAWSWVNLGNGGVALSGSLAVINFPGSNGLLHENVYVLGSDGNLYIAVYDGSAWSWVNLDNGGVALSGSPSVVNSSGQDGVLHESVFILGSDGDLYSDVYDGSGWSWVNLGSPGPG
jgi:uncharacterized protein YfiM (DUF2279 family)